MSDEGYGIPPDDAGVRGNIRDPSVSVCLQQNLRLDHVRGAAVRSHGGAGGDGPPPAAGGTPLHLGPFHTRGGFHV